MSDGFQVCSLYILFMSASPSFQQKHRERRSPISKSYGLSYWSRLAQSIEKLIKLKFQFREKITHQTSRFNV